MDRLDLPKHIVERVERRWAQKLQEQALAWKSSRSEAQSTTATGVERKGFGDEADRGSMALAHKMWIPS